jgi:hypothetical protein
MKDDMNPFPPSPAPGQSPSPAPDATTPANETSDAPAVVKFKSCRWRSAPEDGEFCTHRDVLPFAGKKDFKADSWCPDCSYYKLRRTPKKRDWSAERAGY